MQDAPFRICGTSIDMLLVSLADNSQRSAGCLRRHVIPADPPRLSIVGDLVPTILGDSRRRHSRAKRNRAIDRAAFRRRLIAQIQVVIDHQRTGCRRCVAGDTRFGVDNGLLRRVRRWRLRREDDPRRTDHGLGRRFGRRRLLLSFRRVGWEDLRRAARILAGSFGCFRRCLLLECV